MNLLMKSDNGVSASYPLDKLSLGDILWKWWKADSNLKELYTVLRWKYGKQH